MLNNAGLNLVESGDSVAQSTPNHVAIIMDGNRRWAREKGLTSLVGHSRGAERLVNLISAIKSSDISILTVFGFSSANWQRDEGEVSHLMRLAEKAITRFLPLCVREQVRLEVIGRKDRLATSLVELIDHAQHLTRHGDRLLRLAIDYSSREAIVSAAREINGQCDTESFAARLSSVANVDLLIRTGKEQRLSDFLLWECAFAELYFSELYWPEFDADALKRALQWYGRRDRRFGE